MPERRRLTLFALLCGACVLGVAAAIAMGMGAGEATPAVARGLLPDARAAQRPVVVFRSLGGAAASGRTALVALERAGGRRSDTGLTCDRVHVAAAGAGLCIARGSGFADGYEARILGPDLRVRNAVALAGIPSRARVSPDGRHGAVTMFVAGHSYAAEGSFSTQTTLIDLVAGRKLADLEDFVVTRRGRRITAVDVNFWGVTFSRDGDRFYATLATGGSTYLIEGSLRARTARVLLENVECPSLSPDETRIAYKQRTRSESVPWRETVLDLATMRRTPLAETRSVDDQAEWIDADSIAYGLGGDVWTVPADGGGEPRRLIADADSPAVVRW